MTTAQIKAAALRVAEVTVIAAAYVAVLLIMAVRLIYVNRQEIADKVQMAMEVVYNAGANLRQWYDNEAFDLYNDIRNTMEMIYTPVRNHVQVGYVAIRQQAVELGLVMPVY
jgi:hypothetical protein